MTPTRESDRPLWWLLKPMLPRVGEVYTLEVERDRFGVSVHGDASDEAMLRLADMLTLLHREEMEADG